MHQLPLTSVVKVLDHQLEKFQNEVAKLNAKAIKFGLDQITLKKRRVGEYTVRWEEPKDYTSPESTIYFFVKNQWLNGIENFTRDTLALGCHPKM